MMDPDRKKRFHRSKFVKQYIYYAIVFILQMSLTVVTLGKTKVGKPITMIDSSGDAHQIKPSTLFITLGIGWAAFCLSLVINILYCALHPSQVDLLNIREKLVVSVFGYEINLVNCSVTDLETEEVKERIVTSPGDENDEEINQSDEGFVLHDMKR